MKNKTCIQNVIPQFENAYLIGDLVGLGLRTESAIIHLLTDSHPLTINFRNVCKMINF
jgi:hypothetical protein